jgi:hypothetical protein
MPFKIKKTVSSLAPSGNSVLFNGTNQNLRIANNAALQFGTGDFTVDFWLYGNTSQVAYARALSIGGTYGGSQIGLEIDIQGSTGLIMEVNSGTSTVTSIVIYSPSTWKNQWNHIAVTRVGTTFYAFYNGTLAGSVTPASINLIGTDGVSIGSSTTNVQYWNGYISNLRLVKGTALYTASFTVPTAPLTAITNTQLLTCQSATIIDNSTNNFTITNNNGATVSSTVTPFSVSFSPFKIKKNNVNLNSGFKLKHVSYVRPVYDFTISPAYSGKSTWDLAADGPLILSTSGSWIITPVTSTNTKIKMWGGGGASFKAAWKGGGGGFSSGSVQLEAGIPYRIVTSMNGSNGIIGSGGLTGIFSSSISQANSIMIAGGGGIGTDYNNAFGGNGGAGGGSSGQDGIGGNQGGSGGTQIAGGAPSIYNSQKAGSALQANGGDGGAGYWGGGAQNAAGSGGGSGYIHPTKVTSGITVTGNYSTPANSSDSERSGSAQGSLGNTAGSMGIIIIRAA